MGPVDYARVRQLYDAAVEKDADHREAFLEAACSDPAIRREVESLLDVACRAAGFLSQAPMLAGLEPPLAGDRTRVFAAGDLTGGRFEIEEHVATGGMGEVYRALDRKLDRRVALKVLPAHLSSRPGFRARLEREARAISSLNHPHICSLHDFGYDGATGYLVMEYLEGETLRDRMAARPCTVAEMAGFASEITQALETAHARAVVHRDIKPANLFVTALGQIKMMDFGLAKVVRQQVAPGAGSPEDSSILIPDGDGLLTSPGSITGTVAYMSPEQAMGEAVDIRTDLFSLGVVMYEMGTGRRPFRGDSSRAVMDAILNAEPEKPSSLNVKLPALADRIILKALQKDRQLRYQRAAEMLSDLQMLKQRLTAPASRRWQFIAALSLMALLIAAAALGVRWWTKPPLSLDTDFTLIRMTTNPPEMPVDNARLSPDGRWFAYSDRRGIHIRPTDKEETRTVAGTAGLDLTGWSGDGSLIYALRLRAGEAYGVPISGGALQRLGSGFPSPDGRYRLIIKPDETSIRTADGRTLCRVAPDANFPWISGLDWSPGSRLLAVVRTNYTGGSLVGVLRVSDCQSAVLISSEKEPTPIKYGAVAWTSDRSLLYAATEAFNHSIIWSVEIHPATLNPAPRVKTARLAGIPVVLMSASRDGEKLVFLRFGFQTDVYLCELDRKGLPVSPPLRWTLDEKMDAPEVWASDSKSLYFTSDRNGVHQIFQRRLDADIAETVVSGPDGKGYTRVSPDGKWLVYASAPDGRVATRIMRIPTAGGRSEEVLALNGRLKSNSCSWVRDGPCIFTEIRGQEIVVSTYDPEKGRGREVLRLQEESSGLNISPDGRRIAVIVGNTSNSIRLYRLDGSVEREIVVRGARHVASVSWAGDGKGFYCGHIRGAERETLRVELDGTSQVIWKESGQWAVPSPDGKYLALKGIAREGNAWLFKK